MAQQPPSIEARPRQKFGSKYAHRLRREGKLPAVIYGHKETPAHVAFEGEQFLHHLHEGAHLLQVRHDGATDTCLVKDLQYDYLGTQIIHVDLVRVSLTEEVSVAVPVELRNQEGCPGLNEPGAVLEQNLVELQVQCVATNIPESIEVDLSELQSGEAVSVADLDLPQGVRTEESPESPVVSITFVSEEEEMEAPEELAETEEPEVIARTQEEEEQAAQE